MKNKRNLFIFIGVILLLLTISWGDEILEYAQSCLDGRSCTHILGNFQQCSVANTYYYRDEVHVDDDGSLGAGSCEGAPCSHSIYFDNPSSTMFPTDFWWRMHDHEEDAKCRIYAETGGIWQLLKDDGVHTSGENCAESCSENTVRRHPPGNQGCPDAPPIPFGTGWHTDSDIDPSWGDRDRFPCALSFDENIVSLPAGTTRVRINFYNSNDHIHIFDYIWSYCTPATPTPANTPTPTPTPTPGPLTLTRDHPYIVLFAPHVGMPAQTLRGQLVGGSSQSISITVTDPSGNNTYYTVTSDLAGNFVLDPATAGDPNFGSTEEGIWSAYANHFPTSQQSNTVSWLVDWSPAHLIE